MNQTTDAKALRDLVDKQTPAEVARDFEPEPKAENHWTGNGDASMPVFVPTNPRVLNDTERGLVAELELRYQDLYAHLLTLGHSRELALARTKTEEAYMWAVRHITG